MSRRSELSKRGNLTERLIRILLILAERPWSQQELIQKFKVDAVTIRRNMIDLIRFHPIIDEKHGREVVYRFRDHYKFEPPNLTPGELASLLLAQQSITSTGDGKYGLPFADYGRVLIDKVRAALPKSLREYLDALANVFGSAAVPAKDYSQHTETIDKLIKAAVNQNVLRISYESLTRPKKHLRDFNPYAVYYDPDGATLKTIGHDHESKEMRVFSIDHIRSIVSTDIRFERPAGFKLQDYLNKYCFNGIHGEPLTVRLKALGVTARIFEERSFHPSQKVISRTKDKSGQISSITIEMTVARGRGLERFILGWLPDVKVIEPPELRQKIADILNKSQLTVAEK